MRTRWGSLMVGTLFILSLSPGCGDDGTAVAPDAGADAPVIDAAAPDDGPVAGDAPTGCLPVGDPCVNPADCCSLACDPNTNTCASGSCGEAGTPCTSPTDCCTLSCIGGFCDAIGCTTVGQPCADGSECCSSYCPEGTCVALDPAGCVTLGNSCEDGSECCSLNCQGDICVRAFTCASDGDICYAGSDCCTGICDVEEGMVAGTCGSVDVTGAGGCAVAGQACVDGTNCCSRLCVPTLMGGQVCQVTSGCRMQGELCTESADCCPGTEGLPGWGNMECGIMEGSDPPIGRCQNPQGCNPAGNVCGGTFDGGVNAPQDCCDCTPPKWQCCKRDSSGVPRCFGGSDGPCPDGYTGVEPCCIEEGGLCSFSAECCDGRPCVPDDQGVLRCGAVQCIPLGGQCTSTADCCEGLICDIPPGETVGTCTTLGGTDGGVTDDGGVCALPGQHCETSADCCFDYTCYKPNGAGECEAGDTGCTCYAPIG